MTAPRRWPGVGSSPVAIGLVGAVVALALTVGGCGSSSTSSSTGPSTSAASAPGTVAPGGDAVKFASMSATYYPGRSLDERVAMAEEICSQIHAMGDNPVTFLTRITTDHSVVAFDDGNSQKLGAFTGLAISNYCPQYKDALAQGLAGVPSGGSIGSVVPSGG